MPSNSTPRTENPNPETSWHALSGAAVLDRLEATSEGLSEGDRQARQQRFGLNRLPEGKTRSPLMRFLAQFHNLLIYVLLVAGAIAALMDHWIDTVVILGVVLVNAAIGFVQEGKAEDALRAIRQMLSSEAMVLSGGRHISLPAEQLVPGDIVLLQSGDKVPADIRLLRSKGLQLQEAALTGESLPVEKAVDAVAEQLVLGDRLNMAFSGTLVTQGQGTGVVVATGSSTEIGKISDLVREVDELQTPLLRQMAVFSRWLTGAVLVVASGMFAFGVLLRDTSAREMFMTVVGLAVAAIPEGLPAILTVTLAIGVQRLAQRKAIIRRLPVVETLGSVSVICSDKTGTLTRNEMTVRSLYTSDGLTEVEGTGYAPHGDFVRDGKVLDDHALESIQLMLRAGQLCNDASLEQVESDWRVHGDPMEGALLVVAEKAGEQVDAVKRQYPRTDLIPFESEHRFMATLHHDHSGNGQIFLKGAPEQVLARCDRVLGRSGEQALVPDDWQQRVEALASEGQRVLAIAYKRAPANQQQLSFDDVADGMVLLGLYGLIDPPREEAIAAVEACRGAGIRVKMITGDHAGTARAIAKQLHLVNTDEAITGEQLDSMDDAELSRRVAEVDVYARVSPEHKLRLVTQLQANGAIVAMTGDGVNDAPALKRADVGIAMGHKGTEAAKEASEMVIADDNFASIAQAVEQGRTVYDNLKKAIVFLLPINGAEAMVIMAAVAIGVTLPVTPLQVLWINMVSSVALAMALAFEATEPDVMQRPPRRADEAILSGFLLWRISLVSALIASGVFAFFKLSLAQGASLEEARTYAVNALVAMEVFYLFSVRFLRTPSFKLNQLFSSKATVIAVAVVALLQMLFTYAPFMNRLFETRPVDILRGVEIVTMGVLLFIVLEFEKLLLRRRQRQQSVPAR